MIIVWLSFGRPLTQSGCVFSSFDVDDDVPAHHNGEYYSASIEDIHDGAQTYTIAFSGA